MWKRKITCNSVGGVNELPKADSNSDDVVSAKKARLMLAERSFSPPIVEITLRNLVTNLKDVYKLPIRVTDEISV